MSEKKTEVELLQEKLCMKREHGCKVMSDEELRKADDFCDGYKLFLASAKTERECVEFMLELAEKNGFTQFDRTAAYKKGDKVYFNNRDKSLILTVFGERPLSDGVRIAAAHIDSPRLDLKPAPLYEDSELAYLKPHYYGGIRKYQWPVTPLSLHGVVMLRDGSKLTVKIGEKPDEPRFVISDLLPHLANEQGSRKLSEGIKGEELNIIVGSRPFKGDKGSELVKLNVLRLLNEKYGIVEEDFLSAELEAVPAYGVHDIGFDKSLIGGYGHDDRVCAFPAAMAAFTAESPVYTTVTVLADKEEIGSVGNTGLNSSFLDYFICDLARTQGLEGRDVLSRSQCLSADVNAAFDPTFPSVFEKNNCAYLNHGVVITKYTGSKGKSGTSDASAEFMSKIRSILNRHNVVWQAGELGKVDEGGGGTVAMFIAKLNVDVVDLGVPVLSMHAPFETVSKIDVYMAYRAFYEFFVNE